MVGNYKIIFKKNECRVRKEDRINGKREDEFETRHGCSEDRTKKLRKGKNKAEGDLDSLKTDYKRLRCPMKAAGLGKTSEQWCQEI
ncbi:hypothetical protein Goshw_012124 [Gossypium schwendimanii]|uniref:Uncharacterized protein n=1 Tax=Gossypium schwendimanii TaxID=34291 RepID=A0A7J9L2U4_GOSSC|nr:hypothetical protein [Gossypium schwendimanii]